MFQISIMYAREIYISFLLLVVMIIGAFSEFVGLNNINSGIVNQNVERSIDLTSQLVKISLKINLSHVSKQNISAYTFLVHENEAEHLSFIAAKDASKKELKLVEDKRGQWGNHTGFTATFSKENPDVIIYIEAVFTKMLITHPGHITQSENQLVKYRGSLYFFSPYNTVTQISTIQLGTKHIESYTQVKPVAFTESTIVYGPYKNVAGLPDEELLLHFENNSPFLTITRLERTIEISHWGNVAVEEKIDIMHSGAILKSSFSRYDFQKDPRGAQSAVKSFKTILPASASGVYYRDTNGNISTSNMKVLKDSVEIDLKPRFPLFGGWKTHYILGYNVPSYEYIFRRGNEFLLRMRVVDHIFDDMIIDEATIKIILPEYSTNIKLLTPFPVKRLPDCLHYTYLDTIGRPIISFTKQNLVENHIHDFNLKYNFTASSMLLEPVLIVSFLLVIFLSVIFLTRLDFSINKERENHHHKE